MTALSDSNIERRHPTVAQVVYPGATFRSKSALGDYRSRVIRRHRTLGYWETTIVEGPEALLRSLQIVFEDKIYLARTGVEARLAGTPVEEV